MQFYTHQLHYKFSLSVCLSLFTFHIECKKLGFAQPHHVPSGHLSQRIFWDIYNLSAATAQNVIV